MSEENRTLTIEDPVDSETLEQFRQLSEARHQFADDLLSLEQEKIQLLAGAKRLDDQRRHLFETLLVERGLPPDSTVEIDGRTGKIKRTGKTQEVSPAA